MTDPFGPHPKKRRRGRVGKSAFVQCRERYDERCAYCQSPEGSNPQRQLTRDHVLPMSRGGSPYAHNVVPACRICQKAKADQLLWTEFTPRNPSPQLHQEFPQP